jgi:hypothetical protein
MRGHLIAFAFALTPCFAYLDRWGDALGLGADAAMADVPLAMLLTVGSILLLRILETNGFEGGVSAACALVFVGATLTKQEGSVSVLAILAVAFVAVPLFVERGRRGARLRSFGACSAAVLVAAGAWRILSRDMPSEAGSDEVSAASLAALAGHLDRFPVVCTRFANEFAHWTTWGALWLLPLVCAAWSFLRYAGDRSASHLLPLLTGCWLLSGVALAFASYMVTEWKGGNFTFLMEVSLARLLMHHAPLIAIMISQAASQARFRDGSSDLRSRAES